MLTITCQALGMSFPLLGPQSLYFIKGELELAPTSITPTTASTVLLSSVKATVKYVIKTVLFKKINKEICSIQLIKKLEDLNKEP